MAGCLSGVLGNESEPGVDPDAVVLEKPADQRADSEDLAYPAYGEPFPAFQLRDPLNDSVVDTEQVEQTAIYTAFFASCPDECGILLSLLAGVQAETLDRGLVDAVRFHPITFDPERDDAEMLREFGRLLGVDLDAGNWQFLRPDSVTQAERVVTERLGIGFQRVGDSERVETGYDFNHPVVTFLVNPGGFVERAYSGERIDPRRVMGDIQTVIDEYDPGEYG
jgi:protein SCO1/2